MLGKRRAAVGTKFVPGEGATGGIMFIGDGPGRVEEEVGRPFIDERNGGALLRGALQKLNFKHVYLTNLVACRSCETLRDRETGLPRMREAKYGRPAELMYGDGPPKPLEIEACRARLNEEIYIVDPVLIVTLGATAAEAVLQHRVAITKDRGATQHCVIPGATDRAVHTEKRKVWGRKIQGEMRFPTEQNEVRYLVLPTYDPAYVLKKAGDQGPRSEVQQFFSDLKRAVQIYEKYMLEVYGEVPSHHDDIDLSTLGATYVHEEDPG